MIGLGLLQELKMAAAEKSFGFQFEETKIVFRSEIGSLVVENVNPIVLGHVLVLPCRPVQFLRDLEEIELIDLFETQCMSRHLDLQSHRPLQSLEDVF